MNNSWSSINLETEIWNPITSFRWYKLQKTVNRSWNVTSFPLKLQVPCNQQINYNASSVTKCESSRNENVGWLSEGRVQRIEFVISILQTFILKLEKLLFRKGNNLTSRKKDKHTESCTAEKMLKRILKLFIQSMKWPDCYWYLYVLPVTLMRTSFQEMIWLPIYNGK